jgi:hypothetical protein
MVDGDSKPFSIERCRELLGTEDSGLSDEEIEAIRVQTPKRKYASRASPIFLTNPTVSTTSQFERFGCCWLRRRPLPRQTAMDVVLTALIAKLFDFDRLGAEPASCRSKAGHIPLSRQSQNVPMTLGPFWYLPRNNDIRSAHRLSIIDGARQPQRVSCVAIPASQPQSTTRRTTARTLI